jgi:hypothetical protein
MAAVAEREFFRTEEEDNSVVVSERVAFRVFLESIKGKDYSNFCYAYCSDPGGEYFFGLECGKRTAVYSDGSLFSFPEGNPNKSDPVFVRATYAAHIKDLPVAMKPRINESIARAEVVILSVLSLQEVREEFKKARMNPLLVRDYEPA